MREVFLEAVARSEAERAEYLTQECVDDDDLLNEVQSLLRQHDEVSGGLDRRLDDLEAALALAATAAMPPSESSPTFSPGDRLGDLEILAPLGRGGMGEVYRALDHRLEREVAIKVLPSLLSKQPERLARLEREARALGKLNHPNVATLHGLETSEVISARETSLDGGPTHYLVMELVDGESLEETFRRGPVPYDQLASLGEQIANGLKAAHDHGVVHRDVKPANVMLDSSKTVKLLDFGLARLLPSQKPGRLESPGPAGRSEPLTRPGHLMGTIGYMAPEQLRGEEIDRRTDIWALGCCLYEGLTGSNPFDADSDAECIAAVLSGDPDWDRIPREVPQAFRDLISLCLEKDPTRRLQDLGDAGWLFRRTLEPEPEAVTGGASRRSREWKIAGGAALAVLGFALGLVLDLASGSGPSPPRASVHFREAADPPPLALPTGRGVAVAPDGLSFFYTGISQDGTTRILRRDLDRVEAVSVAGTDGGSSPFVSDDGRWLGFYRNGGLYRVPSEGGPAQLLGRVPATGIVGASWLGGRIVFGVNRHGLYWIDGVGTDPKPIRSRNEEVDRAIGGGWYPILLSRDEVLFDIANFGAGGRLAVLDLSRGELTYLGPVGLAAQYVDDGYLVWAFGDGLWASRFDRDEPALTGPPVRVLELDNFRLASVDFSLSRSGTLVFLDPGEMQLMEVTPEGQRSPLGVEPGLLRLPRLSPDGRWLAYVRGGVPHAQIWVLELASGRTDRLVYEGTSVYPVWVDRDEVLYFDPSPLDTEMSARFSRAPVDHRSDPEPAFEFTSAAMFPMAVARDGSILVRRRGDLWVVDPTTGEARPWLESESSELNVAPSPDGRWLAYDSNANGKWQVYLRAFDGPEGAWPVSVEGGSEPAWSPDGRSLYFRSGSELRAVEIDFRGERVEIGAERVIVGFFPRPPFDGNRSYDPKPDGSGFVTIDASGGVQFSVAVGWGKDLEELLPDGSS